MYYLNREIFQNYPEFFTEEEYADYFGQGSPWYLLPEPHDEKRTQGQIRFVLEHLNLKGGERLLDMGCGFGRLSIPLARGGFQIVGVDLSEYFIDIAREQADEESLNIEFDFCGLLALPYYEEFDAAFSIGNNFGFHEDEAGCLEVLMNAFQSLRPGGQLILEAPNRYREMAHMEFEKTFQAGSATVQVKRMGDAAQNRINVKCSVDRDDRVEHFGTSYLVFSPEEMVAMVQGAGFEITGAFGDWEGTGLDEDAECILLVAGKPESH